MATGIWWERFADEPDAQIIATYVAILDKQAKALRGQAPDTEPEDPESGLPISNGPRGPGGKGRVVASG